MADPLRVGATVGGAIGAAVLLALASLGRLAWASDAEVGVAFGIGAITLVGAVLAWREFFRASLAGFLLGLAVAATWSFLVPYTSDLPVLYWIPAGVATAFAAIGYGRERREKAEDVDEAEAERAEESASKP